MGADAEPRRPDDDAAAHESRRLWLVARNFGPGTSGTSDSRRLWLRFAPICGGLRGLPAKKDASGSFRVNGDGEGGCEKWEEGREGGGRCCARARGDPPEDAAAAIRGRFPLLLILRPPPNVPESVPESVIRDLVPGRVRLERSPDQGDLGAQLRNPQ